MSLTSLLLIPTALFSFIGTILYGYQTYAITTSIDSLILVCIASIMAVVSEFTLMGISIGINEGLLGMK